VLGKSAKRQDVSLVLWKENFYLKEVRVSGKVEGEGGEGRGRAGLIAVIRV
jgi:hypothetical protein